MKCQGCNKSFRISGAGVHRCGNCKSESRVIANGDIGYCVIPSKTNPKGLVVKNGEVSNA